MSQLDILVNILRNGGNVCLTGEPPECDRLEITNVFAAMGLKMQSSPSKHLTFLLVADGAKQEEIDRALELGIPIFSTEDFWNAVNFIYPTSEKYQAKLFDTFLVAVYVYDDDMKIVFSFSGKKNTVRVPLDTSLVDKIEISAEGKVRIGALLSHKIIRQITIRNLSD